MMRGLYLRNKKHISDKPFTADHFKKLMKEASIERKQKISREDFHYLYQKCFTG